jgi:hypothetical protein
MPKASITLANGTSVQIEGSPEEVANVLALYGGGKSGGVLPDEPSRPKKRVLPKTESDEATPDSGATTDLSQIINLIKTCDEAETIEAKILDKVSQVNRILLPLYIVHEYLNNTRSLTSGEVSQITTDLGIPVSQPNASTTLSGTASRYVIGDKVRKKGQAVRYKLSRRGLQYLKGVLNSKPDGK